MRLKYLHYCGWCYIVTIQFTIFILRNMFLYILVSRKPINIETKIIEKIQKNTYKKYIKIYKK